MFVNRVAGYKLFDGLKGKKPALCIGGTSGSGRCGAANMFACGVGMPVIPF